MKCHLRLAFLFALLAISQLCSAADATVSTKLGFETAYVTYGTKFSEETWIPMLDVSQGDYYAGIYGYIAAHPNKSFEGEWDFFAGRTLTLNKLVSFDVGATLYCYPRTDNNAVTIEQFLTMNLALPLDPKFKLFYDWVVNNWIGEIQLSKTFKFNELVGLTLEGHGGFRRPEYHDVWYYATAKADLVFSLSKKTSLSLGVRSTNNTDRAAVGHGVVNWVGTSFGYTW